MNHAQREIFDACHELHTVIMRWMNAVEQDRPADYASSYEWRILYQQMNAAAIVSGLAYDVQNALAREYAPLPYADAASDASQLSRTESSACNG